MTQHDIEALCMIVRQGVLAKFAKEGKADKAHAKSLQEKKEFEEAEESSRIMTEAGLTLAGNFLVDVNRIANALEQIALNTMIQHHPV